MKMGTMKRIIWLALVMALTVSVALADEQDLRQYAEDNLTEVYGYLEEEVRDFVFETRQDGSLAFWPKAHPGWIYTVFRGAYGQMDGTTPFHTGYTGYCGENAVRELLRTMEEKNWISEWSEESKNALLDACLENNVRISTEMYLSESAAQGLQGFFESCYGPTAGWTDALFELRDSVFVEYGLMMEESPFHVQGVHRISRRNIYQSDLTRTYTLFEGEYPDELNAAFSDPHLTGWTCHSGALSFDESREKPGKGTGKGLAAFEKDGKRQLTQLSCLNGQWTINPLGTNAVYPTGDYRVTYDLQHNAFAVQYRLNDDETAAFYLSPNQAKREHSTLCSTVINSYERVNRKTGEAVWIGLYGSGMPTWNKELPLDEIVANFPRYLGVIPITEFPTTLEGARHSVFPGLPEGYVYSGGVNLRTQRSSRSASHGVLNAGTLLPVLERLPGDPSEWIRTKVGFLEGFVVETYVGEGQTQTARLSALPVAETAKEIALKKGTGLFDGTVQALPAGTKMHVIIENGDWLYVDVPQGEIGFLMDVDGTFGYVRKAGVTFLSIIPGLDWAE
jgi:hypothetical protein